MLEMNNNDPARIAEEDIYMPHFSGMGRMLVARKGDPIPAFYQESTETPKETPKTENKAVRKAPATKRQTPSESKE